jgi:Glycosyltransferase family 29 (sialyltransferase)
LENEIIKYCENKSIILIGNGQSINEVDYNNLINEHDIVIRFNHGAVIENKNVGNKTDIWVMAMNSKSSQIGRFKQFKKQPEYILRFNNKLVINVLYKKVSFTENINDEIRELLKLDPNKNPSSGISCIHWLVKNVNYKKLTVIGFDGFKSVNFYVTNNKQVGTYFHDGEKESKYIKNLENNNRLKVI